MKATIDPYQRFRRRPPFFRLVLLFVTLIAATSARAETGPEAGSLQILLKAAASANPDGTFAGKKADAWLEAAIKLELLMRHARLLPDGLSAAEKKGLAEALQNSSSSNESSLQKLLVASPKVDDLVFDGQHYAGGNLNYIDAILGKSGRPIAFDRELPAILVPLTPEAETTLTERRAAFHAHDGAAHIPDKDGDSASALMFADGQFLRPYSGRFDDLYFHLFQNGNGASALAFCALADGLVERVYQPVCGIRPQDSVPKAKFDLDDIFSDGGKTAVLRHLRAKSDRVIQPFKGFAFRVLPSIVAKARTLPAGARFTASQAEILHALRTRQHLYPTQVPPLYRSPDRFLGWAGSLYIPVANGPALPPGAADSWYPLPERDGRAPIEQAADGASSDRLFKSSSTPDFNWEDPLFGNLLTDPENKARSPKPPTNKSSTVDSTIPKWDSDPRRRTTTARLIAVVTPTADEARDYLTAIATSDEKVRGIERTRGRIRLMGQFIESARRVSTEPEPDLRNHPLLEPLQQALAADLASFQRQEGELAARLQTALQERADFRAELENRLRRERVEPLQALGKKAEDVTLGL